MEIEVTQEKLSKALNNVSRVAAGARATLAVLNNVLIRVDNNKVSLTTTNLDMAVVNYLPVSACKNGVVTVPARLLAEFVSNLPRGEKIHLMADGTKITTKAGKYSSVMNGTLADDFPELPGIDENKAVIFDISADEFKNGINQVIIASSNDLTRPALTGVYFNTFENSLYIAATDGYRLAEKKFIAKVESEVKAIVPASSLQEVLRAIDENTESVKILFDETQVRFRLGDVEITSKLIDGSFPDYRKLIPEDIVSSVELKREELSRVTKLAALFARSVGGSIVCECKSDNNTFSVATIANEFGENNSEIEAEVENDAKVNLNSKYLIDAINVLSEDKIVFNFTNKMQPIVLKNAKNKDYTHIVMPLKG